MKHVPPPSGIPISGPELTQDSVSPGLATQVAEREEALQRVRRLRKQAADEIDRLLGFLDAIDPYVTTEMEDAVDDSPCDDHELEASLCGVEVGQKNMAADSFGSDLELDTSDDEPNLGSGAVN